MIEILVALLMTAVEKTCLVEADHPLVIEAQEVAAANAMAGVVIIAWGSSEECRLLIAPDQRPTDMVESAKSGATKLYDWWNREGEE